MFADLHIHTYYSDSTRSPAEVVALAKEKGIKLISICDHNIISAYPEITPICKAEGISLILGAEISALFESKEYHILGYGFNSTNKDIVELLDYSNNIYVDRGIQLIEKMSADFGEALYNDFLVFGRNPKNGGWASIDYLITKGLISGLPEYFNLCRKYSIADKNKFRSIAEVTDIIHRSGGKAVFAHAGDMLDNTPQIFNAKLPILLEQGIDGFECYYTSHKPEITQTLIDFCKCNNLIITAGSDDHGGFNNVIDGHEYYIGAVMVDTENLNLKGIEII